MIKHKWHTEIRAWAEGKTIQSRFKTLTEWADWRDDPLPQWFTYGRYEYRIKDEDDWNESRMDTIGQNGNVGYEELFDEL
jgi:hypothetical protein